MSAIESFKCNYGMKGMQTDLLSTIHLWDAVCPIEGLGLSKFKLYLQIKIDHPTETNPFYIFEKDIVTVTRSGTENCEICYGTGMKDFTNADYRVSMTCHSKSQMEWFMFFMESIKNNRQFTIDEVEEGIDFIRVVLS